MEGALIHGIFHGDLHAENFGTYMDGKGALVFDVNDFDEAYLGHFTWDLQRFAASVARSSWPSGAPWAETPPPSEWPVNVCFPKESLERQFSILALILPKSWPSLPAP